MDDEIDDLVGEVKLTESQKSVESNMYSVDFTDSSSDKNNSSGKDTYVIDCDSEDSDSSAELNDSGSIVNVPKLAIRDTPPRIVKSQEKVHKRTASTSYHHCTIAQDTFTQTSKTIIQLAEAEGNKPAKTLETQTSNIYIVESRTVERTYQISATTTSDQKTSLQKCEQNNSARTYPVNIPQLDFKGDAGLSDDSLSDVEKPPQDTHRIGASYTNSGYLDECAHSESELETSFLEYPDFEAPKCIEKSECSEVPTSVDNDVDDLYTKFTETIDVEAISESEAAAVRRCGVLTPLTEESVVRKDSFIDITPHVYKVPCPESETVFSNSYGINVKFLTDDSPKEDEGFKLPPIGKNVSCPSSPKVSLLFTMNTPRHVTKSETPLQRVIETEHAGEGEIIDRKSYQLASGEGSDRDKSSELSKKSESVRLPPIHHSSPHSSRRPPADRRDVELDSAEQISIGARIRELKSYNSRSAAADVRKSRSPVSRRRGSPSSSSEGRGATEMAERSCETLCGELLRRLHSVNWMEIADVLEDVPRAMENFWDVITEQRIQDFIRQVSVHVESPRTQVARSACNTLALILKNTNYTKKPEFNEAISCLLVKTGSYNRAVRRAANMALDTVASSAPSATHFATAVCVHGAGHKNPLVRTASARLLCVCTALAGGGRDVLRCRPAAAAHARRATLRAMAALLGDRNTDARKYAERLYTMIRPLPNFEAYYLTDVDVELASAQMKKYDQLLAAPSTTR